LLGKYSQLRSWLVPTKMDDHNAPKAASAHEKHFERTFTIEPDANASCKELEEMKKILVLMAVGVLIRGKLNDGHTITGDSVPHPFLQLSTQLLAKYSANATDGIAALNSTNSSI